MGGLRGICCCAFRVWAAVRRPTRDHELSSAERHALQLREYFMRNVSEVRRSASSIYSRLLRSRHSRHTYTHGYDPLASASPRSRSPAGSSPRRSWRCPRSATGARGAFSGE